MMVSARQKRSRISELPTSPMFDMLIKSLGTGKVGPSQSNEWAIASVEEGARGTGTVKWASLGDHGKYPANVERDLHRFHDIFFACSALQIQSTPYNKSMVCECVCVCVCVCARVCVYVRVRACACL